MNLLKTEYLQASAGSTTTGTGEWELRNGVWSMRVHPAPFWGGSEEYGNANFKGALRGHFSQNTSYVFNLWMDVDDSYYDAQSKNVPGGFVIVYTDGTSNSITATGNKSSPTGWRHQIFISPSNKTIDALYIYYWTNTPVYYRYDSYISPFSTHSINKNGILNLNTFSENQNQVSAVKGGAFLINNIIEY